MKRILISQNEENNGEDYVVVDGNLIIDKDLSLKYYRKIKETESWKENFKDDFIELKSNKKDILIKSHYLDTDNINRYIYYMYYVKKNDDLNIILDFLEKDSEKINRNIDKEKTLEIINRIKANKKLTSVFLKVILILAAASIAYGVIKSLKL
ncbi:hypothetical protein [Algibacter sp. 2305UL17-15]|uniref:hypothetical protein n=1 Tax=Algibacter sp. 2305UL17-15 TaxID=3231268 RepID=UPI00345A1181